MFKIHLVVTSTPWPCSVLLPQHPPTWLGRTNPYIGSLEAIPTLIQSVPFPLNDPASIAWLSSYVLATLPEASRQLHTHKSHVNSCPYSAKMVFLTNLCNKERVYGFVHPYPHPSIHPPNPHKPFSKLISHLNDLQRTLIVVIYEKHVRSIPHKRMYEGANIRYACMTCMLAWCHSFMSTSHILRTYEKPCRARYHYSTLY